MVAWVLALLGCGGVRFAFVVFVYLGTVLASFAAPEEAACEGFAKGIGWVHSWEEAQKESQKGVAVLSDPPFLGRPSDSPKSTTNGAHLALPRLQSRECYQQRQVQLMQVSLEASVATDEAIQQSPKAPTDRTSDKKVVEKNRQAAPDAAQAELSVFPTTVPWMPTTPQARLQHRQAEPSTTAEEAAHGLPAQPVLPPPPQVASAPSEGLTQGETTILEHLRALAKLGCEMPSEMQSRLQALEQKAAVAPRTLSHGHLNQLNRLQKQLATQLKKISDLDIEWRNFIQVVTCRIQDHAGWYQAYRAELVAQHEKKSKELESVKQMVTQASMTLVGNTPVASSPPEARDTTADMLLVNQALSQASKVPVIHLEDEPTDMEDMEEMEEEGDLPDGQTEEAGHGSGSVPHRARKVQVRPFATRSPTKVASTHLKTKTEGK
eukprot:Skav214794  [mRNA]  locus=scaffold3850:79226:80533:+ [translate_table: standard]